MSPRIERVPVRVVAMQHVEEAAHLRHMRSTLVRAPHVRLLQLGRLDERVAAHLDGIEVSGKCGVELAHRALERPGTGELFVATVRAIEDHDTKRLDKLLAVAEALPSSRAGLLSAFGWTSAAALQGIAKPLLEATTPWLQEVGLAACGMHAVDPGGSLVRALDHASASLRSRALLVAGRCGRRDLMDACLRAVADQDENCAFEAARAALLLGDRSRSLTWLEECGTGKHGSNPPNPAALRVVLKVLSPERARALLSPLAQEPALIRVLIRCIGIAGDPQDVPWLLAQMEELKLSRLAGEALSFITGLDLAYLDLDRKPPSGADFGPSEDPNDENVGMDEDDSLPWPNPERLAAWWHRSRTRFLPGNRYFMGGEPTSTTCLEVLKTGFQRQRIAAAEYLSLLAPGTPLFNTAAPTWRQRRLLSREER